VFFGLEQLPFDYYWIDWLAWARWFILQFGLLTGWSSSDSNDAGTFGLEIETFERLGNFVVVDALRAANMFLEVLQDDFHVCQVKLLFFDLMDSALCS
jgi:hypothetical protein